MSQTEVESAGAVKGSLKTYVGGFVLALVLTVVSFGLVMSGARPRTMLFLGLWAAAALQILVHLHYFLHLDTSSAARWNVLALLFTVLIMFIFVGGSIWIMFNLNYRMM